MESIIFKTLLHSLWQGLILALLTAAVIIFTSRSSARLRYNLLISCFILFSIGVFASFIYEWKFADETAFFGVNGNTEVNNGFLPGITSSGLNSPGNTSIAIVQQPWIWIQSVWSYFNSYATTIVLLWLLVIAAKSVQLFAGLYSIKRIRNTKITDAGVFWKNRVQELAVQFGIHKVVAIVQSGLVNVPMVVGYFKPLILVPIGLLNNLSKEEVEAIICHELAHVKRRDYLVNILQSFMELLFFFNPAVLWISGLIREERESCCDDLAVLNTNNKVGYISALVSCEEFQMNKPQYAMAIAEDPGQLVKRVKRIVSNDHPTLTKMEQRIMAVALLTVLTLSMAFSSVMKQPAKQPNKKSVQKILQAKEPKAFEKGVSKVVQQPSDLEQKAADIAGKSADVKQKAAAVEQQASSVEKNRSIVDQLVAATERVLVKAGNKIFGSGKTKTITERSESETAKSTITKKFVADDENAQRYNEKIQDNILEDLIKDHLVAGKENLSFEMDKDQFVLNDQKLPEDIRKKYAKKYIKSVDWIISYQQEFESK
ncbi:M56 family metallopeptidase [Pedobacter gandavensis]|uniref:M48 family metalloprotease n=1 Tax=Pedobacter gandavensis TaxID=2679963 RepID=A0ABR6EYU5_9SPHI|nr:M56 family metallopeptidase [Pedobacter gandavensis]MBB2150438.1 M48 family metalloprotease [Pedobacter gandavensis]